MIYMEEWLLYLEQLRSIAQAGLHYTKDVYDKERFEQLLLLTEKALQPIDDTEKTTIRDYLTHEQGYITPKVDVRAVVINVKQELLLVQEKADNCWSLPGGWADIGYTPKEIAVKEVWEEAGIKVQADRLLRVVDNKHHDFPESLFHTYKLFIACTPLETTIQSGIETASVAFFPFDHIASLPLSTERNTFELIKATYNQVIQQDPLTDCD